MTYAPYPHRNRSLVKALYCALRDGIIDRRTFAVGLRFVMGKHYED